MDSIHHLSTSLPRTRRRLDQPELLSDFKAAALSVTNLYKTAAAQQDRARAAGYQDAVEDLLAFLDAENLGLMDGEGWRVRQWATQNLVDEGGLRQGGSDDEREAEGKEVEEQRREPRAASRSSSPEVGRKQPPMPGQSSELDEERVAARRHTASEPPTAPSPPQLPTIDAFTFRSSHAYPTNHDRDASNMDMDTTSTAPGTPSSISTTTPDSAAVRVISRPSRGQRHNRRTTVASTNSSSNTPTINFSLGNGAGSKRKMPYPDFFDISGVNFDSQGGRDGRDGRGGKRGRHV